MYFSKEIIRWYHDHKRDLPWRDTRDPYIIWLSEVILQQTRVEQGLPYFHAFVDRFPDVASLAEASEDEILKLWEGLGYYSRARNMHSAAKSVMTDHGGVFPRDYQRLKALKGVGPYTAGAVASFAAAEPRAVVDGNVFRVISRYLGIDTPINSSAGAKEFQRAADRLLDREFPGLHNQAIMEFGALQCVPRNPCCEQCVLRSECVAFAQDIVGKLPVKLKAKPVKNRFFVYFLYREGDQVLVHKRDTRDIWANLYQLPLVEMTEADFKAEDFDGKILELAKLYFGADAGFQLAGPVVKHLLSHQRIHAQLVLIDASQHFCGKNLGWNLVEVEKLNKLAKPRLISAFLEKYLGILTL